MRRKSGLRNQEIQKKADAPRQWDSGMTKAMGRDKRHFKEDPEWPPKPFHPQPDTWFPPFPEIFSTHPLPHSPQRFLLHTLDWTPDSAILVLTSDCISTDHTTPHISAGIFSTPSVPCSQHLLRQLPNLLRQETANARNGT